MKNTYNSFLPVSVPDGILLLAIGGYLEDSHVFLVIFIF